MAGTTEPAVLDELKGTAAFDFAAVARRSFDEFPELRGNLVFYNREDEQLYSVGGTLGDLRRSLAQDGTLDKDSSLVEHFRNAEPGSAVSLTSWNVYVYARTKGDFENNYFPVAGPADLAERFVLEHEIGHVLTRATRYRNIPGTNLVDPGIETMADAFGLMRIAQLFGNTAAQAVQESMSLERCLDMIEGNETSHWTAVALDKIMLDAKDGDFVSLTPEQAIRRAEDYAWKFTPLAEDVRQAAAQFAPLKGRLGSSRESVTKFLEGLARIVAAPDANPYTVYSGARLLREFLKPGGADIRPGGGEVMRIELTGPAWDQAKRDISAAIDCIPDDHILRRLDLKRLDVTEGTERPEIREYASGAFNGAAQRSGGVYTVSHMHLDEAGKIADGVALSAAEVLDLFAPRGLLEQSADLLVTRTLRERLHALAGESPELAAPLSLLSGKSPLDLTLQMVGCTNKDGGDTALYVLTDKRRHRALIVGDEPAPPLLKKRLARRGVTYCDRQDPQAGKTIDGFFRGSAVARGDGSGRDQNLIAPIMHALSLVVEMPPQFFDGHDRLVTGSVGEVIVATKPEPTIYTKIMRRAGQPG